MLRQLHDLVPSHVKRGLTASALADSEEARASDNREQSSPRKCTLLQTPPSSPSVCFLCSSNRSAELMEELPESLSSRARVSY